MIPYISFLGSRKLVSTIFRKLFSDIILFFASPMEFKNYLKMYICSYNHHRIWKVYILDLFSPPPPPVEFLVVLNCNPLGLILFVK